LCIGNQFAAQNAWRLSWTPLPTAFYVNFKPRMQEKELDGLIGINSGGVRVVFISLIYSVPFHGFVALLDVHSEPVHYLAFLVSSLF